jgi:carbon-monoxide dehydrogenase large subunit
VGGAFGQRSYHYPEEAALLWATHLLRRPVRWTSTRSENLLADAHGRDHVTYCAMAFAADGRILGIKVDTVANLGAYQTSYGAGIAGFLYPVSLSGPYRIPAIHARVRAVYTNTTPVDAYRGAGRPEAAYVTERLIENAAREMQIDPLEMRARNFVQPEEFPYVSATGMTYDSGNYPGLLAELEKMLDLPALRAEQARLRSEGTLLGIGFAAFIDASGGGPTKLSAGLGRRAGSADAALVRVHPTGKVTVFCGSHSHGQGHATAFAQVVADRLHRPVNEVEITYGDTDQIPFGQGTFGSRSLSVVGSALHAASAKVICKGRRIASCILECSEEDVDYSESGFSIPGTDRRLTFEEVAHAAYFGSGTAHGYEHGLEELAYFDPLRRGTPSAIHCCVVLVDAETGKVTVREMYAVDDAGRIINPMIVHGQIHGGLAQGIGQALMESVHYEEESGQMLTGSFLDYSIPRANDLPSFRLAIQETLSPDNPLGVKGAGESGTIGAPAAISNAVLDALWHMGVRHIDLPLTSARVWAAMEQSAR